MATTVQQILDGAYGHSSKNDPGTIATAATELLQVVIRATRGLYSYAARINPLFFAESAAVAFSAPGWARPVTAESIWRIELPSGAEVVTVPFDDKKAELTMPAVWEMGQVFRTAGNSLDPVSGNLTFFYAKRPTDPATLAANLDVLWTDQFNDLLMLEVAIYLAIKDNRLEEIAALKGRRDPCAARFGAFLEHATINERRRFAQVRRFPTNTTVPLKSLLAGGEAA